jgi:hypothetical protein
MSSEFDPYRELLDIKSPERPPNHYDLLGIDLFEGDRVKIDDAAGERMSRLQELANSEHMDASQKLLNEVSAARRCLLNETKKMAYDEDVRTRQRRASSASSKRGGSSRGGKRGQPAIPIGIALGMVILLGIIWLGMRGGSIAPRNLIVDWPVSERSGASILLDGDPLQVPNSDPINLNIPLGRHRLVFQRAGYKDIPKTITFENATIRMRLTWITE